MPAPTMTKGCFIERGCKDSFDLQADGVAFVVLLAAHSDHVSSRTPPGSPLNLPPWTLAFMTFPARNVMQI
jgi:hypothetical protein